MSQLELCFVFPSGGNLFMRELLEVIAGLARQLGVATSFAADEFPHPADGTVYVVIPHEYFGCLSDVEHHPEPNQLRRTISFCVEHPGTQWFELSATWARVTAAAVDINRSSAAELRRRGLRVARFQLGYCDAWDRWHGDEGSERVTDVLYMGSADERRAALLAGYAETLSGHSTEFLIPPLEPKLRPRSDFLVGNDKYDRLAGSKILLNLHRGASEALEWLRVAEAISNGCVVVSEHSVDPSPLVAGEHFISGSARNLGHLGSWLLNEPDRLQALRQEAYRFARTELQMRSSVEALLDLAEYVLRSAPQPGPRPVLRPSGSPVQTRFAPATEEIDSVRFALKHLVHEIAIVKRSLDDIKKSLGKNETAIQADQVTETYRAPTFDRSTPTVSVAVSLYNYETEIVEALASVASSRFASYEVIIVDDASTDRSVSTACGFLDEHWWLPAVVLQRSVNRGLARARNTALERARGEFVLILDADNGIFPTTLERLVEALVRNPQAAFAYPMLAERTAGRPVGLRSCLPWEPERLANGNYIDALSLLRRKTVTQLGGYREDPRLLGWEDFDLWCRLAEAGHQGILVPGILAWYRKTQHSMLSLTNIDTTAAWSVIRETAPTVLGRASLV